MRTDRGFAAVKARNLLLWLLGGIVLYVAVMVAVTIAAGARGGSPDEVTLQTLGVVALYVTAVAWAVYQSARKRVDLRRLVGGRVAVDARRIAGLVVLLILFSYGASWVVYYPLSLIDPDFVRSMVLEQQLFTAAGESAFTDLNNTLILGVVVLVAPVVEELIFRGFLLTRWAGRWGLRAGVVLSSLLFAVVHVDLVGKFAFGLVMAILYLNTRSLLVPMAVHAANNAVAVVAILVAAAVADEPRVYTLENFRDDGWTAALCFLVTLPLVVGYIRRNWPARDAAPPYLATAGADGGTPVGGPDPGAPDGASSPDGPPEIEPDARADR